METNRTLPTIHPGTPGHYTVTLALCVRNETPKALHVELPEGGKGLAWLPISVVGIGMSDPALPQAYREPEGTDPRCFYPVRRFTLPVWLYRKVEKSL